MPTGRAMAQSIAGPCPWELRLQEGGGGEGGSGSQVPKIHPVLQSPRHAKAFLGKWGEFISAPSLSYTFLLYMGPK